MGWFEDNATAAPRAKATSALGVVGETNPYVASTPNTDMQPFRSAPNISAATLADPANHQMYGGTGGGYQPYSDETLQAIIGRYPPTNEGMRQADAEVQRTFGPGVVELLEHPLRLDKFRTPTGTYDAVIGAGGPNPQHGWMREGGPAAGGGGGAPGVASGSLLGDPMAGRSITDDPSYKFRLGEGLSALERSAASKGTLLTGGFMKAMQRYAQDVASTEYGASYDRRAQEQANNFGRLYNVTNMGLGATGSQQQQASGYAGSIASGQLGTGQVGAAGALNNANANAAMIGTLGNVGASLGQSWYDAYRARQAQRGNPVTTTPAGRVNVNGVDLNYITQGY